MCQMDVYVDGWCTICQRVTIFKNGVCTSCYPQVEFQQFNYECPECHGKFNYPAISYTNTTNNYLIYKCPFCGQIMEGLNG